MQINCSFSLTIEINSDKMFSVPSGQKMNKGVSPSGKAMDSDSIMRRFESCYPSQTKGEVDSFSFLVY